MSKKISKIMKNILFDILTDEIPWFNALYLAIPYNSFLNCSYICGCFCDCNKETFQQKKQSKIISTQIYSIVHDMKLLNAMLKSHTKFIYHM